MMRAKMTGQNGHERRDALFSPRYLHRAMTVVRVSGTSTPHNILSNTAPGAVRVEAKGTDTNPPFRRHTPLRRGQP